LKIVFVLKKTRKILKYKITMIEENILTVWVGAVEKEIRNVKKKTTAGGNKI